MTAFWRAKLNALKSHIACIAFQIISNKIYPNLTTTTISTDDNSRYVVLGLQKQQQQSVYILSTKHQNEFNKPCHYYPQL